MLNMLLLLILHTWIMVILNFVDFAQFDEKWCCGCWIMVRSWLYDVVVVVLWCSHQFMLWVLMKVLLWLSCVNFATFVKIGFLSKSHFRMRLIKLFDVEMSSFKCSFYGLSGRDALAKTESKSDSKTRFYARKCKNALLMYWWGDTAVCLGDTTMSGSSVRGDTAMSVLQNAETSFFRVFVYF